MNEAYDLDNFSPFEVETVEEAPISQETSSSYDSTSLKIQKDQVALLKLHNPLQLNLPIKSLNVATKAQKCQWKYFKIRMNFSQLMGSALSQMKMTYLATLS